MSERHCRPAPLGPRDRRESGGCAFPASGGLSPEAAARPGAMARLILRRVGIAPLLSLFAAPLLALLPTDPVEAQQTRAHARVVVLPHAVRVQQGQVSVSRPGDTQQLWRITLPPPQHRACTAQDAAPAGQPEPACRLIITDLP